MLNSALALCVACNGEYDNQAKLAKTKKCELKAAAAELAKKPDDMMAKEKVERLKRGIKNHEELSGNASKLSKELEAHTCP